MAERNPAVWVEFRQDTGYIDDMARRAARQLGDDKALRGDRDHLRAPGRISAGTYAMTSEQRVRARELGWPKSHRVSRNSGDLP